MSDETFTSFKVCFVMFICYRLIEFYKDKMPMDIYLFNINKYTFFYITSTFKEWPISFSYTKTWLFTEILNYHWNGVI